MVTPPTNLPAHLPPLIGREKSLASVCELLLRSQSGLLTLTGAGGCGKTVVALAAAAALRNGFPHGVWLVELAPLADPQLVPGALVSSCGLMEQPGRTATEILVGAMQNASALLILDNCEHLVESCASLVADLLRSCAKLRILATSREPLRISGERIWRVPTLAAPDPRQVHTPEQLTGYSAVQLFVERARAVQPDFQLTTNNCTSVARICARLDGLPLALELAAARARVLGPDQIERRLDDAFGFLTGGERTAPTRHQTLRATLDWSFRLLDVDEQHLFPRLAVFAGGFDLPAVEALWPGSTPFQSTPLDTLTRLVDRSLVVAQSQSGDMRYRMLEPVRQYAHARLVESGDLDEARQRHSAIYLALAERGESEYKGPRQDEWSIRFTLEHDNLRAALRNSIDRADAEHALRLGSALWLFWRRRGHRTEGQRWLEEALELSRTTGVAPAVRARAFQEAGELAYSRCDYAAARAHFEAALSLWRQLDIPRGVATTLEHYGRLRTRLARTEVEYHAAMSMLEEALVIHRQSGDEWGTGWALQNIGHAAWEHAELERAARALLESIPIFERLGDQHNAYHFTVLLAGVERDRGNFERSQHLLEDCISEFRTTDCAEGMATTLYRFSLLARDRSDTRQAIEQAVESASCYLKLGMRADLASGLELLAGLACDQKEPECAVRLFSAASTIREDLDVPVPPVQRAARDQDLASARTALIAGQFASAWTVGRAMPLEQQLEHAASALVPTNAPPTPHLPQNVLTRREREVAMLIARGYTNRQIAQELVISERTADGHVANILAKLGLQTRVQAAVWVVEHQLATRTP